MHHGELILRQGEDVWTVDFAGCPDARGILSDVAALSSGTLAGLTGERRYAVLDEIRGQFLFFVDSTLRRGARFLTWHEAWRAFWGPDPDSPAEAA